MTLIVVGGLNALWSGKVPVEFFPDFESKTVTVTMNYRGASPSEVEKGVVSRIEEAIFDLEGIAHINSDASEGRAVVSVEMKENYDLQRLKEDIKSRVDAISTFPLEAENLLVQVPQSQNIAVTAILSGLLSEGDLKILAERIRDEMSSLPGVSQVEIAGLRDYEIGVEVAENSLQKYGLTLGDVANAVRSGSIDVPAGQIRTKASEYLLRTEGQAYLKEEFEKIPLRATVDGVRLTIGDVATVIDGFEEDLVEASYKGKRAAVINVLYSSDQNLLKISKAVKKFVKDRSGRLPEGVSLDLWRDRAKTIEGRLQTLVTSAVVGLILVFALLTLFLRIELAIWVCVGIPVTFLGAIACMPWLGITVNIVSLFAFILVLGIVVDDAIVTSENVYVHLKKTADGETAAIEGTQEVAVPVTFGVLTTIAAFVPLLLVDGRQGEIFYDIPAIVIPVLLFSLVESKLILPAHLKHIKTNRDFSRRRDLMAKLGGLQQKVAISMEWFVERIYSPVLNLALRWRYATLALFYAALLVSVTLVRSERIRFVSFPNVESETITISLTMPQGTPYEVTARFIDHIENCAMELSKDPALIDPETGESIVEHWLATKGAGGLSRGRGGGGVPHVGEVSVNLVAPEDRSLKTTSAEIVDLLRKKIGPIPGAESLFFRSRIGGGRGEPVEVQLSGDEFKDLEKVAAMVKNFLLEIKGVRTAADDFQPGKPEIKLKIKPEAEQLDLTMASLGQQTRQAFFGEEAQRIQRGRDDVRVMVRYPLAERSSLENLERMRVRTPNNQEVPFADVAEAKLDRAYSSISRVDRKRTVRVQADIDKEIVNEASLLEKLREFCDEEVSKFPGMSYRFAGEIEDRQKANASLLTGVGFALLAIYALLAIPFSSYFQPLIVMHVIIFGPIGAILGHLVMDMDMSLFGTFGILALTGVVVNDSLVMVDYINRKRRDGASVEEAAKRAGPARFRPILLTSLTTFFGLIGLLTETSTQAQFLIPMAISLGFGILFATVVTLFVIPISYLIYEDLRRLFGAYWRWQWRARGT